jgi:prepilin-type N-terminal cleavage/methylation domain-containing protein
VKNLDSKPEQKDQGMTLVELLVSISLGLIVLSLLATMMIGVYGTQDRVSRSSNAATQSQIGSEVFRAALRSSTGARITSVLVDGNPGQLLVTRTLDSSDPGSWAPTARCIAILWSSGSDPEAGGTIYWFTGPSGSSIPLATSSQSWPDLIVGISPIPLESGGSLDQNVFSVDGNNYTMAFVTQSGTGPKTTIRVSVMAPNLEDEVSGGCF